MSFQHSVGRVEGSSHAKIQLDSFIRFDRTPTCDKTDRHRRTDGQTDRQTDGHRAMASTRASKAPRGLKNVACT